MPALVRHKTKYPGVFFIVGKAIGKEEPERIYYIMYRRDGRLLEEKAGRQYQDAMTPARASAIRIKRLRGEEPSNAGRREEERVAREAIDDRWPLTRLFGTYNDIRRGGKPDSTDKSNFAHLSDIRDKEPHEVVPLDVDRVENRMKKAGMKPGTIKKVLALLVRIARFGEDRRLTAPLTFRVKLPKVHDEKTEFLTPEEAGRLATVLDSWADPHQSGAVRLSQLTGMRRGEVFNLKWKEVNLAAGSIHIARSKGGKPETIPVSSVVVEFLRAHPRGSSPYVFHGSNGGRLGIRIKKDGSGNWPREITRAAEISDDFRPFHGHRHTFASTLASEGTDLYTIQVLLTQKSPQMTKRYAHLRDESLRRAAEVAARALSNSQKEAKKSV